MPEPTVVCILGMHRSGTSLAARVLNLLGVSLGPEQQLMRPGVDNPTGFWEHRRILALNEGILVRLGGSWSRPPAFPPGWECSAEFESFRQRARKLIGEDFTGAALWGWKDPRTCLTLPLWQHLLPSMRYVICLRHPIDVARSLERRNSFSLERGIYLWLTYMKSALVHTLGQPRSFFVYERFLSNWRQELPRLAEFLEQPQTADRPEVQNAVQEFTNADLHHHRTSAVEAVDEARFTIPAMILRQIQSIYECLKSDEHFQPHSMDEVLTDTIERMAPLVEQKQIWEEEQARLRWEGQLHSAIEEMTALVPLGEAVILVDEEQWGVGQELAGRRRIPFPERDGQYWGLPPDDRTAIQELERLRQAGAHYMAFAWPAFWWFYYYPELRRHLDTQFRCILENDRLVMFDLQSPIEAARSTAQIPA